jgi:RHS repeat-associated protein
MGRKQNSYNQLRDGLNTSQARIIVSLSSYNEIGQLMKKGLHAVSGTTNFLQTVNYRYNPRGWLTNINNPTLLPDGGLTGSSTNDQFGMELKYDNATTSRPQYNGNIATVTTKTAPVSGTTYQSLTYDYRYDKVNRLNDAVSSTGTASKDGLHSEYLSYNTMGDITALGRYDNLAGVRTRIDSLTYSYSGYRQTRVDDSSSYTGAWGFTDAVKQVNEYLYDGNGNTLKDLNKGITGISYNMLNLPQTITKSNGNSVAYVYDASGRKLRKISVDVASGNTMTTEYVNGIEYDSGTAAVTFIQTEEGRARKSGSVYKYEYDLKDHLGNTRLTTTWAPADSVSQLTPLNLQHAEYYAFGYTIQSLQNTVPSPKNLYLYNHKELQEETGLYDYGGRFYDPVIGRWISVDPLAEKGRRWSPYVYGFNNPIIFVDPDGMWGDYYGSDGTYKGSDKKKDGNVYVADAVKKNNKGVVVSSTNAKKLSLNHNKFTSAAHVVKAESSGDKEESNWIANSANNAKDNKAIDYKNQNSDVYDQLTDPQYSTTPASAKTPLSDDDNSSDAKNARAAIINVLTGKKDPTGGADSWDGSDFLKRGSTQRKFKDFTCISISAQNLSDYVSANPCIIPQATFAPALSSGTSYQESGSGKYHSIRSTGVKGKSIFWKTGNE